MKKNMKKDILVMGFAMFAIFFGSGNLIFPPIIGLVSGEQVGWAIIGLALTGIDPGRCPDPLHLDQHA